MPDMKFSSKHVSDLVGMSRRTLRHYHNIGLLEEPPRDTNGYRNYTADHVLQLIRIKRLTGIGLSLDQVAQVLQSPGSEQANKLLDDLDKALADQISAMRAQRRVIASIRKNNAPIDVLPEYAQHISALRSLGASDQAIEADKIVIDIVAGLGTEEDTQRLQEILEAATTGDEARWMSEVDEWLGRVDETTSTQERDALAEEYGRALIAFYENYAETHDPLQWSDGAPIDAMLTEMINQKYNDAQKDVIQRATNYFARYTSGEPT